MEAIIRKKTGKEKDDHLLNCFRTVEAHCQYILYSFFKAIQMNPSMVSAPNMIQHVYKNLRSGFMVSFVFLYFFYQMRWIV
jgi:hypothetical protein